MMFLQNLKFLIPRPDLNANMKFFFCLKAGAFIGVQFVKRF